MINKRIEYAIKSVMCLFALTRVLNAEIVTNGGFELPTTDNFIVFNSGSNQLVGWQVSSGSVDVANGPRYGMAYEGNQWLDLYGTSPGVISQVLTLVPNTQYSLNFAYANNPNVPPSFESSFRVQLNDGPTSLLSTSLTHQGSTGSNMNFTVFQQLFTATTNSATLSFESLVSAPTGDGIVLDAISITTIPEPTSFALLSIALSIAIIRRTRSSIVYVA